MTATLTARLTVAHHLGDRITCSGGFPTANKKGFHSGLRPQLLLAEIASTQLIVEGDTIECYDDGTNKHVPRAT